MQICRELAGFSFGQADNVRRAMSKKKLKVMEAEREHFVHGCTEPGKECAGCVENGIPEAVANQIYDDMISFASYAFNKSHAACLRLRGLPDSLPQVPLPPRVHGRPADQCTR